MYNKKEVFMENRLIPFTSTFSTDLIWVSVPDAMITGMIFFLIAFPLFKKKNIKQKIAICLMFIYSAAVLSLTAFPFLIGRIGLGDSADTISVLSSVTIVPFRSLASLLKNGFASGNIKAVLYNIGGNIILLMPFGVLLPVIKPQIKNGMFLIIAFFSALSLEIIQLIQNLMYGFSNRDVNIDDFILNLFGCMLSYFILLLVRFVYYKINKIELDRRGCFK